LRSTQKKGGAPTVTFHRLFLSIRFPN
jgi:hypothetical protein